MPDKSMFVEVLLGRSPPLPTLMPGCANCQAGIEAGIELFK
jgi:hypothetical protein